MLIEAWYVIQTPSDQSCVFVKFLDGLEIWFIIFLSLCEAKLFISVELLGISCLDSS